jgi:hypothetical protein
MPEDNIGSRTAVCIHCQYQIPYTHIGERERVWFDMAEHETVCAKNPVLLMVAAAEAERDLWKRRCEGWKRRYEDATGKRAEEWS